MTTTMIAGIATAEGLTVAEVARPTPSDEQILVRVVAAGMNRADLAAAKGMGVASANSYGKPIGMEWAGEVVEIGSTVTDCVVGDWVACSGTGGYAEYAVADQHRIFKLRSGEGAAQAAVLPLALMTAHDALVVAGLRRGETVFVHGATSAVGLATLQIAKILGAAKVIGGARSGDKRLRLVTFGADGTIDTGAADWSQALFEVTDSKGADVAVDMVSGPCFGELMKGTAIAGRIVNVGRLGGTIGEFDFNLHALRRISFHGVTFRTRSLEQVRDIVRGVTDELWPSVESGSLSLPIDRRFDLADAVAAHAYMAGNQHFGKILLDC
ncbi:zinc-binding dehydrogenase [Sphingopyxis sp. SE2]|uniref:zinc-binding dehydrogenase n=1 Tax=Sphingopyxis sp. SE2 TaxID=1586240 RepID=UPI0028C35720|nr:zinc-binding dehydrogenase [Sphingopyxis sp. SE2]MDT7531702.1 zinc-binding dehydrogenase [Sphingopyxis sp. SE2]